MIKSLYAVRDIKTSFATPFLDDSDESAIRGFGFSIANAGGITSAYPQDFALYRIASFDTASGEITPILPQYLACGADFVRPGDGK